MPSSARAAAPACRQAGALEVRYRAAMGIGEEAYSRQRHGCLWSKPVNVETWRHVPGPIVMAQDMPAELRYGIVAMPSRKRFQMWAHFAHTLTLYLPVASGCACAGCARTLRKVCFVRSCVRCFPRRSLKYGYRCLYAIRPLPHRGSSPDAWAGRYIRYNYKIWGQVC